MWKPGAFVYPIPAVMVTCGDMENSNIITIAWTGITCSTPAKVYISVRPERYSYEIIKDLTYATDWCRSKVWKRCR